MERDLHFDQLKKTNQGLEKQFEKIHQIIGFEADNSLINTLITEIINDAYEGVMILHEDKIVLYNLTSLKILPLQPDEDILHRFFIEFVHPDERGKLYQKFIHSFDQKNITSEINIKLWDTYKTTKTVKLKVKAILVGQLEFLVIYLTDNSRLMHIERQAQNLAQNLKILTDNLFDAFLMLKAEETSEKSNNELRIVELNESFEKLTGIARNNALNEFLSRVLPVLNSLILDLLPKTSTMLHELYFQHQVNDVTKNFAGGIVQISTGNYYCFFRDISEIDFAEKQLSRTLQQQELITEVALIFNSSHDFKANIEKFLQKIGNSFEATCCMIFKDDDEKGIANLVNIWSLNNGNYIDESDNKLIYRDIPEFKKMILRSKLIVASQIENMPESVCNYFKNKNITSLVVLPVFIKQNFWGFILIEHINKTKMYDSSDLNILRTLSTFLSNAFERQQYEENLRTAKEKAEEADKLKTAFLTNLSHEIRTPMNSIIGFSDLLADPDLTTDQREDFIALIRKSGYTLLSIIENIIDISRLETNQLTISNEESNIDRIIDELYYTYQQDPKIRESETLSIRCVKLGRNYTILSDSFRIKQVLNNLLDNAVKFTDQGFIEFGYRKTDDNKLLFFVKDTGIGISEANLNIIFDRFSKITQHYTRQNTGTGLGLAISKQLVDLLGGKIWVESQLGKGSVFYFTLPDTKISETIEEPLDFLYEQYSWPGIKILVADDVESNYKVIESLLIKANVEILWAKNGEEAVMLVQSNPDISAVLMDIQMPVMNGYDATRAIRKQFPGIPVIAQTAYAMTGEKEKCIQSGFNDYLTKPIRAHELFKTLEKHIFKQ